MERLYSSSDSDQKSSFIFILGHLIHLIYSYSLHQKTPITIICIFCWVIRFSTLEWLSLLSSIYSSSDEKIESPRNFFVNAQPKQTYIINIREWQFVNFFSYEFMSFQCYACCCPTYWTDNFGLSKMTNKNDPMNPLKNN